MIFERSSSSREMINWLRIDCSRNNFLIVNFLLNNNLEQMIIVDSNISIT